MTACTPGKPHITRTATQSTGGTYRQRQPTGTAGPAGTAEPEHQRTCHAAGTASTTRTADASRAESTAASSPACPAGSC